jgi:hypothetical protein
VRSPQQAEQAAEMVNRHPSVKRVINSLTIDTSPVASQPGSPQPIAQSQPQPQPVDARSAAPIQAHPASVLMPRMQQPTSPSPAVPTAVARPAEQPMREASLRSAMDNRTPARTVAAPIQQQPQPARAPETLQPVPTPPRPIGSVMSQPVGQPTQGRMMAAAPVPQGPSALAPNGRPMTGRPVPASYRQGEVLPSPGPGPGVPAPVYNGGGPLPQYVNPGVGTAPAVYDQPYMPNYSWPSYAPYPNYAALTYPKQYSPTAWPYIGPFYPYPQVPLGWRKVTLEWDDGWWFLNFADDRRHCGHF